MDTSLSPNASTAPLSRELLRASWRSWYSNDLRRVGPYWLQWVWTFVFSAIVAVGFTIVGFAVHGGGAGAWRNLAGWAYWYGLNLVVSCSVGFTIHALFELSAWAIGRERIRSFRGARRALYQAGVPILGLAIGWPFGLWLISHEVPWVLGPMNANSLVASALVAMLIAVGFSLHFMTKASQIQAEQQAAEAQLKLLQGQMEPHFLFNTLANVLALMDEDAPKARQTLQALTDYLRSSLGQLRRDEAPLAAELELVENYLALLKTRMDDRLAFHIDADAAARAQPLPPLLLQPLVENAIHHGLEPKVEGGTVHIAARLEGRLLHLEVSDDGLGPDAPKRRAGKSPGNGNGVAMANLRQRLLARYGTEASLDVAATSPGTRVRMTLPLDAVIPA